MYKRRNVFDYSLFHDVNLCKVDGCTEPYYGSGYCKKHHQWHWARGLIETPDLPDRKDIIVRGSCPVPELGCWVWLGSMNNQGYGKVSVDGEKVYSHRLSYEAFNGPIPDNLIVCHKCDNPLCCNPDHLWLGTFTDNSRDCVSKGRNSNGVPASGVSHKRSVLSNKDIEKILSSYLPATHIAKEMGVNPATVRRVRSGDSYRKESAVVENNLYA